MRSFSVGQHMVRSPYTASPEQGLNEASEMMQECQIRHLPVVESGELKGVVSDRDLKAAMSLDQAPTLTIGDVMKTDVFAVDSWTPLSDIAREMADGKIGSAIVIDSNRTVIGIFTTTDALRILSTLIEDQSLEEFMSGAEEYADAVSW